MKIGGLQKNSFIDYPGKAACVVFTSGCNFRCPFCHNPDLVHAPDAAHKTVMGEEAIFSFLQKRTGLLDGVVITGGEPCIQKFLSGFCRRVKQMGFAVKLDTNGSCPDTLNALLDTGDIDFVAMDIKSAPETYAQAAGVKVDMDLIKTSIALIMEKAPAYEFRTTCLRPFTDETGMEKIGRMIQGAANYTLQPLSRTTRVLDPAFLKTADRHISPTELASFKTIADRFVENCRIR